METTAVVFCSRGEIGLDFRHKGNREFVAKNQSGRVSMKKLRKHEETKRKHEGKEGFWLKQSKMILPEGRPG